MVAGFGVADGVRLRDTTISHAGANRSRQMNGGSGECGIVARRRVGHRLRFAFQSISESFLRSVSATSRPFSVDDLHCVAEADLLCLPHLSAGGLGYWRRLSSAPVTLTSIRPQEGSDESTVSCCPCTAPKMGSNVKEINLE